MCNYIFNKEKLFYNAISLTKKNHINFIDGFPISVFLFSKRLRGANFTEFVLNHKTLLKNKKHFFLGFEPKEINLLCKKYPLLSEKNVFAYNPPYIRELQFSQLEIEKISKLINKNKINYLWIGIGNPKQEILTKDLLTIMNDLVDNYKLVDGKFVKKSGEASATATPVTSPKGEELDVHPENYIHKFSNEDIYECFSYFEDSDLWGWYFVAGKSSETNGRICEDSFNQGTILSPTKWEFYPSRYQEGSLVEGYNLILEAFSNKQGTLSHMRKS